MNRVALLASAGLALAMVSAPALAQDLDGHQGHTAPAQEPAPDPHAGHVMPSSPAEPDQPATMGAMDHGAMDHAEMDHGTMDHGPMAVSLSPSASPSPGPVAETPPPPEAGSGPPRAADAVWGAEAMRASRRELQQTHGDFAQFWFQADRAEVQMRQGEECYLWDVQGYYGGPTQRFWFKSEGEGSFGDTIDDAEFQALYSHAIGPFFDLQAGVRQDIAGSDTSYGVVGIQGHAPYMFEIDGAIFLSHRGDLTARFEAELDQRITRRLILQPRAEINLAAQDVPQLGIGAGIDRVEAGLRLRYEIRREFAPYIGVEQSWRLGGSADFARAAGEDPSVTNFVAGIRFWF